MKYCARRAKQPLKGEPTMRLINEKQKPEICCSKDQTRPHLCAAYLDVDRKTLVSTDGHRLITVPVEVDEGDTSGPIPPQALADARRYGGTIKANGAAVLSNGATFERPDVQFPPYGAVIESKPQYPISISFNAKYLAEIAKALDAQKGQVTITFDACDQLSPIHITTPHEGHAWLMPCRA